MKVPPNKSSSAPIARMRNSSSVARRKRANAKLRYEKPRIVVYSKEGKDFWCD